MPDDTRARSCASSRAEWKKPGLARRRWCWVPYSAVLRLKIWLPVSIELWIIWMWLFDIGIRRRMQSLVPLYGMLSNCKLSRFFFRNSCTRRNYDHESKITMKYVSTRKKNHSRVSFTCSPWRSQTIHQIKEHELHQPLPNITLTNWKILDLIAATRFIPSILIDSACMYKTSRGRRGEKLAREG